MDRCDQICFGNVLGRVTMSFFDDEKQIVPLVTCDDDGKYTCHDGTLAWLSTCKEPICPVACAGRYRTGKSFLLNRLSDADSNCGFGVGDSIQACTKGLWIYKKFFDGPNNTKIVFIDTEGIDALDANDTHDVRVFTLALLLSSAFLYNSVGAIDETALQTLNLMTRVVNNVKVSRDGERQDLSPHMPRFFWILRDFSLRLTDKQNRPITRDEYLENALRSEDRNKCHIRDAIRGAFVNRSLVTLPRPTNDDNNMNRLESRLMTITPKFHEALEELKTKLYETITPMRANDNALTGASYTELIKYYSQVVTTDAVPVIQDSWALIAAVQGRDLKEKIAAEFDNFLDELDLLQSMEKMARRIETRLAEVLDTFDRKCMQPCDETLKRQLRERCEAAQSRHIAKMQDKMDAMVREKLHELDGKVDARDPGLLLQALKTFRDSLECDPDLVRVIDGHVLHKLCHEWLVDLFHQFETARQTAHEYQRELHSNQEQLKEAIAEKTRDLTFEIDRLTLRCSSLQEEASTIQVEKERLEEKLTEALRVQHVLETQDTSEVIDESNALASEIEEKLQVCASTRIKLESELCTRKDEAERLQKRVDDLLEEQDTTRKTHTVLEENWKKGITRLEDDARRQCEKLRAEHAADTERMCALHEEAEKELRLEQTKAAENQKLFDQKLAMTQQTHERDVQSHREQIAKLREQVESVNSRLMEVHKTMMSDIRQSNDKMSENQTKYSKSQMELQTRYADSIKETEQNKAANAHLKRRICDLEEHEKECKRLKGVVQDSDLNIACLGTELAQLRQYFTEANDEKERLRKENMRLYGELSILNADKKLQVARENILS